jgi:DNA integrity scanning protein DisA with diadenylate cyclase activity
MYMQSSAVVKGTEAVALCASQPTGTVSVFKAGQLVADIHRPGDGSRFAI